MINGTVTHEIFVSRRGQLRILIFWHLCDSEIGRIYLRLTLNWQSNPKAYEEIERTSVRNAQPPLLCDDFKNSWQRQGQKKPSTTKRGILPLFKAQEWTLLNAGCPCALDRCRRSLFGGIIFDGSFIPPSSSRLFLSNYSPFFPFTLMRPDMTKKKLN